MNVLQLAEALTAETERHDSEIARIIAEFTGTTRPVPAVPDGILQCDGTLSRRTIGIIRPDAPQRQP